MDVDSLDGTNVSLYNLNINHTRDSHSIIANGAIIVNKTTLTLKLNNDFMELKTTELPITDRYSTGSTISKVKINDVFEIAKLEKDKKEEQQEEIIEEVSLEQIDERIMTIDDFLDDFKIE